MNRIMIYKGYWTVIRYSKEDNCFWGEIEGIRDSISFEGNTIEELREDFEGAIDDYINLSKRYKIKPNKQKKLTEYKCRGTAFRGNTLDS